MTETLYSVYRIPPIARSWSVRWISLDQLIYIFDSVKIGFSGRLLSRVEFIIKRRLNRVSLTISSAKRKKERTRE